MASVRDADWKLIAYTDGGGYELYDIRRDLEETVDLAEETPETRSRYQRLLERWLEATSEEDPELESDPDVMEELRALGYVQ